MLKLNCVLKLLHFLNYFRNQTHVIVRVLAQPEERRVQREVALVEERTVYVLTLVGAGSLLNPAKIR